MCFIQKGCDTESLQKVKTKLSNRITHVDILPAGVIYVGKCKSTTLVGFMYKDGLINGYNSKICDKIFYMILQLL